MSSKKAQNANKSMGSRTVTVEYESTTKPGKFKRFLLAQEEDSNRYYRVSSPKLCSPRKTSIFSSSSPYPSESPIGSSDAEDVSEIRCTSPPLSRDSPWYRIPLFPLGYSPDSTRSTSPTGSLASSSHAGPRILYEVPARRKPVTLQDLESMERFKAEKQVSLRGKYDVLVYSIPETDDAYVFCHNRTNTQYQIFQCVWCWKFKAITTIIVIGDEFLSDPCKLDHVCIPVNKLEDRLERITHKWLMELREKTKSCKSSPKKEYRRFLKWLGEKSDEEDKVRKTLLKIHRRSGGFKEHQKLFSRFCKPMKQSRGVRVRKYQWVLPQSLQDETEWEFLTDFDGSFGHRKMRTAKYPEEMTGISTEEKFWGSY
ncbi:hypothetical protein RB195_021500 [Necator americanus]|uniref:Uncharacterized protein n=1 Tax=Necator americanus TaxID=51031 RepID=A0ABR1EDX9_NECAM